MIKIKRVFSLIDVVTMVVIVVLGIGYLSMGFCHGGARESAYRTKCLNNLKQMGLALAQYSSPAMYGRIPAHGPKSDLYNYGNGMVSDDKLFLCPSDNAPVEGVAGGSYQRNGTLASWGMGEGELRTMGPNIVVAGDGDNGDEPEEANHQAKAFVLLFNDGHCKIVNHDGETVSAKTEGGVDIYDPTITSNPDPTRSWLGIRD